MSHSKSEDVIFKIKRLMEDVNSLDSISTGCRAMAYEKLQNAIEWIRRGKVEVKAERYTNKKESK